MVFSLALPDGYGWVILAATSFGWLNFYQTFNVGRHRKASGIKYPQMYAEKAEEAKSPAALQFNCAQRAHQNTLESLPQIIVGLVVAGLRYPTAAAALGGLWCFGRILYTMGYSTGDPAKRLRGSPFMYPGMLGLQGLATWTAVQLACEAL